MHQVLPRYKNSRFNTLLPDYRVDTVDQIDVEQLRQKKVRALALDADNTIVEHNQIRIRPKVLKWLKSLHLPIYLTTNRLAPHGDELGAVVGAELVIHASAASRKPQLSYFKQLQKQSSIPLKNTVMVGDRLLTDILGGNKAGMVTVYVRAIGNDPFYVRWTGIRLLERLLINVFGITK